MSVLEVELCEVNKAKATHQRIATELGEQVVTVPATKRDVFADVRCEQWLSSDRRAVQALLAAGNGLERLDVVQQLAYDVLDCVTQRKLKLVYGAAGELPTLKQDATGGLSSRHAADGARAAAKAKARGESPAKAPRKAEIADMLLLKFQLAAAGVLHRSLKSADIGTAYPRGERTREPAAMRIPLS